jgi:hypothetical protein
MMWPTVNRGFYTRAQVEENEVFKSPFRPPFYLSLSAHAKKDKCNRFCDIFKRHFGIENIKMEDSTEDHVNLLVVSFRLRYDPLGDVSYFLQYDDLNRMETARVSCKMRDDGELRL